MAHESGLGHELYVDGVDLGDDVRSVQRIGGGHAVLDHTSIRLQAFRRVGGLRDGSIEGTTLIDDVTSHPTLAARPTTDRIVSYVCGTSVGSEAACLLGKQVNYDPTRAQDGDLAAGFSTQGNGFALEWGRLLARQLNQASGGAGTALDYGAAVGTTSFGAQVYLHVHAFTGTSITVALQHSDDNAAGDPYANVTNGVFAAASAVGAQRIQTARDASIKRWLRINTTGTFSDATVSVIAVRNLVAVEF